MRGSKNPTPGPLESARREAGLSRKKLSNITGVSCRTIECYEQGKNNINMAAAETVRILARALNVPMERIMNEEENTSVPAAEPIVPEEVRKAAKQKNPPAPKKPAHGAAPYGYYWDENGKLQVDEAKAEKIRKAAKQHLK